MVDKINFVDFCIFKFFLKNVCFIYKEFVEFFGMIRQRIFCRMNCFEQSGVILKYIVIFDYDVFGYVYVVFGIILKFGVNVKDVIEVFKEDEYVKVIQCVFGFYNFVIYVIGFKDMREFERIIFEIFKKVFVIDYMDVMFIIEIIKFEIFQFLFFFYF